MSIIMPEYEIVDRSTSSIRYLEHGWPSELCRWHSHPEYELHLILETRGKAFVGDYFGEFDAGALFLTGPNLPHNWVTNKSYTKDVPVRDMLVQFDGKSVEHLLNAFPEFGEMQELFKLAQMGIEFVGFNPTFAKGHMEAIRDTKGAERIVAFLRFLVRINEHAEKKTLSVTGIANTEGSSKHARIGDVVDHITKNFAEEISVEAAAELAGMSPTAFTRNFQKATGNRFIEFVNRVRIGQACSMLYASDEQISSICYEVGFQNLANFNRQFLKMKGMTPSEYRAQAQRNLVNKESTEA